MQIAKTGSAFFDQKETFPNGKKQLRQRIFHSFECLPLFFISTFLLEMFKFTDNNPMLLYYGLLPVGWLYLNRKFL